MEETKRRRFIIRAVLEGEVDVQEEPQPTRIPIYEWDFTESLLDKKQAQEATIAGSGISRTSEGLVMNGANGGCLLGANVFKPGSTLEVDFASMSRGGTQHGRLIMFDNNSDPQASSAPTAGFIFRSNPAGWACFKRAWSATMNSDSSLFSGKTLVFKYYQDDDGYHSDIYCNDTLVGQYTDSSPWNTYGKFPVTIGCAGGQSYYDCVITAARIYED